MVQNYDTTLFQLLHWLIDDNHCACLKALWIMPSASWTTLTQVSLCRNIDRNADAQALVEEMRRLIEFSLELVKESDNHVDC